MIALGTILGVLAGLAVFLLRPAEYTAETSLYVSAQVGDSPQQAYQGAQLSEQRVKSYNELVTGDRVMSETISQLGLPESPAELAKRVSATSALDSVIINIAATDESADQASKVANTVALVVTRVVGELEQPSAPNGLAPVAVRVVQPAPVPLAPSSAGLPISLTLGLIIGIAFGTGAAFVRNSLDNSIKSAEQLTDATEAPNLGVIVFDADAPAKPLTVQAHRQSARAEGYRQLRTNLQFVDVDNPRKVLVVTSSVPGEGKTTTVANLAIALAAAGSRTLVIEGDLRRPKLSTLFGLDRSIGLTSVLSGRVSFQQAIQPWDGGSFDVLSSGPTPPNPSELLASNQMKTLVATARGQYDIVLIDTPPLLPVTDAAAMSPACDGTIIVCRFNQTVRQQVSVAVQSLRSVSVEPLGSILTMVPEKRLQVYGRYQDYYSPEVADAQGDPVGVAIPGGVASYPVRGPGPRAGQMESGADGTVRHRRQPPTRHG